LKKSDWKSKTFVSVSPFTNNFFLSISSFHQKAA